MVETIRASRQGLQIIDVARQQRRWNRQSVAWCDAANVSQATLKRFWRQLPINPDALQAICAAVRVNWQEVVAQEITAPHTAPVISPTADFWVGREPTIRRLVQSVRGSCRLLALTGLTGTGKTALSAQLAHQLWEPFTQQQVMGFESSEEVGFGRFASHLLSGSGASESISLQQLSTTEVVNQVVSQLVSQPTLVILDGLEAMLQGDEATGWSTFKDPVWGEFLRQWLAADSPASRIILTCQEFPAALETIGGRYVDRWHCEVVQGLTPSEQMQLFARVGLNTTQVEHQAYLQRIGAVYEGHPLALRVIAGEILGQPFLGNVPAYWQSYHREIEAMERLCREADCQGPQDSLAIDRYTRHLKRLVQQRIEYSFERLRQDLPQAYRLLCLGSVYRRPVKEAFWLNMLEPGAVANTPHEPWLDALRDRYLIEDVLMHNALYVRQHNLIRTVALHHLQALPQNDYVDVPDATRRPAALAIRPLRGNSDLAQ